MVHRQLLTDRAVLSQCSKQFIFGGTAMKLLRSLRWLLVTVCLTVLIILVGGTLIGHGTVTRHNHMVVSNAVEAYGGLAVVVGGFVLLIKAGSSRRRKRMLSSGAQIQVMDEDARRRAAAAGFDMQQKQQQAFLAQQRAAQQRSWEGR